MDEFLHRHSAMGIEGCSSSHVWVIKERGMLFYLN